MKKLMVTKERSRNNFPFCRRFLNHLRRHFCASDPHVEGLRLRFGSQNDLHLSQKFLDKTGSYSGSVPKGDMHTLLAFLMGHILDPLKAIGVTIFCVVTLFLSSLAVTNGDLTFYSSAYLSLTFFIYALLAMGIYFAVDIGDEVWGESGTSPKSLTASSETGSIYSGGLFLFVIGLNVCFTPLMLLSGQRERLPLSVIFLTFMLQLLVVGIYQLLMKAPGINRINAPQEGRKEVINFEFVQPAPIETSQVYQSVLINGALTPLAESILEAIGSQLTYLVLLDQDSMGLAALKSWLTKKYPKLVVATSVVEYNHGLDPVAQTSYHLELESFFKTYKPEIVFDLDRFYSYRSSQVHENYTPCDGEDFPPELAYRNIILPRNLIDVAQKFESRMVISLSGCSLSTGGNDVMESFVEATQTWLECYAQRQDGTQTRVVPLRCYQPLESSGTINIILDSLWKKNKKDICLSSSVNNAHSIVGLVSQLLRNPSNHGGIWSLTSVLWVKRVKLQKYISNSQTITEVRDGIGRFLAQIPVELLEDPELTETSLSGAALVKDCPLVDMDFDAMMACFEPVVTVEKNNIAKAS